MRNPEWLEWSRRTERQRCLFSQLSSALDLAFRTLSERIDLIVDDERRRTALMKLIADDQQSAHEKAPSDFAAYLNDPEPTYFIWEPEEVATQ